MFSYRCLRCGKQHNDERSFAEAFSARCLRCTHTFTVTRELIHAWPQGARVVAWNHAIITQPAGVAGNGTSVEVTPDTDPSRSEAITTPEGVQHGANLELPAGPAASEMEQATGEESTRVTKKRKLLSGPTDKISEEELAAFEAENSPEEETSEESPTQAPAEKNRRTKKSKGKKASGSKTVVLVTAIILPLLLAGGAGAYFVFNRAPSKKPAAKGKSTASAKKAASTTASAKQPETTNEEPKKEDPKKEESKKPGPPPAVQIAALRFSAARLAAELAADPEGTNRKYKGVLLEVSGILDKIARPPGSKPAPGPSVAQPSAAQQPGAKPPAAPPPVPEFAYFVTKQAPVMCDMLTLVAESYRRVALQPGRLFKVRGSYRKDGVLENCQLLDATAIAEPKYAGKTIEVVGAVDLVIPPQGGDNEFPVLMLEGETNSKLLIRCVFGKAHLDSVTKVQRGTLVTIRGTCSGRRFDQNRYEVRIDNCELVDTTAREPSAARILAADLARDYEEDLRPYYVPPRGMEPRVETLVTVTDLSKAWKADRNGLQKYHLRIITVTGTASRREPPNRLILAPAETDQPLRVVCLFAKDVFAKLGDGPQFRVTGLCMGLEQDGRLRLDNCEVDAPQLRKSVPLLTADFLPHREGSTQTYDLAVYPPLVKSSLVVRQTWYQRKGGITETVITHSFSGQPPGRSLFPTDKVESWLSVRKTKKTRLPGPLYMQKTSTSFVEFGQRVVLPRGGNETVWEPVLKLGAKVGDSWEWVHQNNKHVYTVVGFETHRGRRSVIVQEVVVNPMNETQTREIRHVYVEGVGEIERREWQRITSKEKKLLAERKMILVEELPVGPPKPTSGDDKLAMPKKEQK